MKASRNNRLAAYYRLTKPGIIRSNVFTGVAGFIFASGWPIDWRLLLVFAAALWLIIASACVFNNYIDRTIDRRMERTKNRPLVQGIISGKAALIYATALGISGFSLLAFSTNWLTFGLGVIAYLDYIIFYGWTKRHTVHGTLVGTISGAIPPVAGYTVVTNQLDVSALLLFLILVTWEMAHFYAIALYRLKDYSTVDIPVYPAVRGSRATKLQILGYMVAFGLCVALLAVWSAASWVYAVVVIGVTVMWFYRSLASLHKQTDVAWGKSVFLFSLIVLSTWSVVVAADALLR
jgi:protoheme IX farnesyltransferase